MNRVAAVFLGLLGLFLAIALTLVAASNMTPGNVPYILVATMMPGVGLIGLALRIWNGPPPSKPLPSEIPEGHIACTSCGKIVPTTGCVPTYSGAPIPQTQSMMCQACSNFRSKRALRVLFYFLVGLGLLVMLVTQIAPRK